MNLKYRGSAYQAQENNLNFVEKRWVGKYRGQDCYRDVYDTSKLSQSSPGLKYRGVAYGSHEEQAPSFDSVAAQTVASLENTFKIHVPQQQKPIRSSRHHVMSDLDRVHNKFLLEKLEKRISSARQKGDQHLIQMLEREKRQLN